MVIIRITGGLGNQMFQYAAGKATALRTDSALLLNTSFFGDGRIKQTHETKLHLEVFPAIKAEQLANITATEVETLESNSKQPIRRNLDRILRKLGLATSYELIREQQLLTYQPNFHGQLASTLNLASDWQNEQYFIAYENIIRASFIFPPLLPDSLNAKLLAEIQSTDSVAIHVRRGDYLLSTIHQQASLSYYQEAVGLVRQKVVLPNFFVFSDDIEWCKLNLDLPQSTYVTHNAGEQSFIDMQLMSNCKHNIIANSSFSWWGAWLNNHDEKLVIAPEIWLSNPFIKTKNIVPKSWTILSHS